MSRPTGEQDGDEFHICDYSEFCLFERSWEVRLAGEAGSVACGALFGRPFKDPWDFSSRLLTLKVSCHGNLLCVNKPGQLAVTHFYLLRHPSPEPGGTVGMFCARLRDSGCQVASYTSFWESMC